MHVVTEAPGPWAACGGALEVVAIPAASDNLVWVAACVETGEAAIVDGPDAEAALAWIAARGWRLRQVINTHLHGDHVGVNIDLQRRGLLDGLEVTASRRAPAPGATRLVDDGDEVAIGRVRGRVLLTEGHQDGHVSYVFGDVLFCGDTLFAGGCGFLFDGPPAAMFRSLMRLAELDGATRVCCAHEYTEDNLRFALSVEPGNAALVARAAEVAAIRARGETTLPSTIELERATNPFLRPGAVRRAVADQLPDRAVDRFEDVFAATRALKDTRRYKAV